MTAQKTGKTMHVDILVLCEESCTAEVGYQRFGRTCCFRQRILPPNYGGMRRLRYPGTYVPDYTASQPRGLTLSFIFCILTTYFTLACSTLDVNWNWPFFLICRVYNARHRLHKPLDDTPRLGQASLHNEGLSLTCLQLEIAWHVLVDQCKWDTVRAVRRVTGTEGAPRSQQPQLITTSSAPQWQWALSGVNVTVAALLHKQSTVHDLCSAGRYEMWLVRTQQHEVESASDRRSWNYEMI
jgi:hypothetical protein